MRSALALSLSCAAFLVASDVPDRAATLQRPTQFRTSVTGRGIPVLVREGQRPVTDLRSSEFVLSDSGVEQEIRLVAPGSVSLDVSLVVQQTLRVWFTATDSFRSEVTEIARVLKKGDRLRIVSAGDQVEELIPLSERPELPDLQPKNDTCTPLYDALASVFMRPVESGRQHVVISLSRDEGWGNIVNADALTQIAQRSDAVLHVLLAERDHGRTIWRTWTRWPVCAPMFADWDTARRDRLRTISGMREVTDQDRAIFDLQRERLVSIAKATGGGEIRSGLFTGSIKDPVQRVLEEARAGYLLYYEPKGVPERGWHPIEVKVTRPGRFEVRARPGYLN